MTRHSRKASDRRFSSARAAAAALAGALAGLVGGIAGCADPGARASFDADEPAARIRAIRQAARSADQRRIPELIETLDSDDPAQRLFAIRTLERMTGQTLGYDHAAPQWARDEAVLRWVEWARAEGLAVQVPGSPPERLTDPPISADLSSEGVPEARAQAPTEGPITEPSTAEP